MNRENYLLHKKYLEYRERVDQLAKRSLKVERTYLKRVLRWAGETSFKNAHTIRPTLPEYLLTARLDDPEKQLGSTTIKKTLSTARGFLTWVSENEYGYRSIKLYWIKTLKHKRTEDETDHKEVVTFEEALKMAAAPVTSIVERRIRAATAFWYLTGIRIGAFVSLPILAIDIKNNILRQDPNLGVRTKLRKKGTTFFHNIPELLVVVIEWDFEVRAILPETGFWFAPLSPIDGTIDPSRTEVGESRDDIARKNLKAWLDKVGLEYRNPHAFKHGHIHYGLEISKDMADMKTISQNAMHESLDTTLRFYSRLDESERKRRFENLSKKESGGQNDEFARYQEFLEFQKWRKAMGLSK